MIQAAAHYAEGKGPPPQALRYALQAQTYHALPEPGGLRDQPVALMVRMAACHNVYTAWKAFREAADKVDWKRAHPEQWKIVSEVMKLDKHD